MEIKIRGAFENNLKYVDVDIKDGLTVVTGVSGSGKTSLIFDTLYREARRRFLEAFSVSKDEINLNPAKVSSISGLGPMIALGQNLLNRNPNSILASATGLIPLLKILYARYGERNCHVCGSKLINLNEDEILAQIASLAQLSEVDISALLVKNLKGSHKTLLDFLIEHFGKEKIIVNSKAWNFKTLDWNKSHTIQVHLDRVKKNTNINHIRDLLQMAEALGVNSFIIKTKSVEKVISHSPLCLQCGTWFDKLEPSHFNKTCPYCKGKGCKECNETGFHPLTSNVTWEDLKFPEFLSKSVKELIKLFSKTDLPTSDRLKQEIWKRLNSLVSVGLEYLTLDRSSPSLSRGESQRVRLAIALLSELEDITHLLDEPTIGQHPADVARLLPIFQKLAGPVIYIEHDKIAALAADQVIDVGPGAGKDGGEIIFTGTPAELWKANTPTGNYFSMKESVKIPKQRTKPTRFLTIKTAGKHNLKDIDVKIPLNRLTVVTGVSGSGKSTLIEDVLFASLKHKKPIGCAEIDNLSAKTELVNQGPIGNNPRSNPATYTKIADAIRKIYAKATKYEATYFSFNTPEGQCPTCNGMGALEIKMRYLPSNWIKCMDCEGQRFSEEILAERVKFGENEYNIAELYEVPISELTAIFEKETRLASKDLISVKSMLKALNDIGLGYLSLGQPSPTLSGGESQRVKLSKYLGKTTLNNQIIILDEPSTGLHPQDLTGLLTILDRLIKTGATIVIVEHNIDIIRAADWIIDLGPGSGPGGGMVLYEGPLEGLLASKVSLTARALVEDELNKPSTKIEDRIIKRSKSINIKNAHIHNLNHINLKIPKNKFTVVTGVSGSGKSSLIMDTLELEARRRYLETLSMYERQGTKETMEALIDEVSGLGMTALISPEKIRQGWFFNLRNTVGKLTELHLHLANLFAYLGQRHCPKCQTWMKKNEQFYCEKCNISIPIPKPRHFISSNYSAVCLKCHGIGSFQVPNPTKLIIHPEKPLCKGAMYSPGFFPKGYLCKPYNVGYYLIQALADKYGFDQFNTPWNEISEEAKHAFLYGDNEPLIVNYENKKGQKSTKEIKFLGFYEQWLRDWDVGGTYSDTEPCDECKGTKYRPQYLEIFLFGYNIDRINKAHIGELYDLFKDNSKNRIELDFVANSFKIVLTRLEFLKRTGLGYIHLDRVAETLSAGEAQRIRLAGLLGSDLTSLTILLDEPSRGLHPSELLALLDVLLELRDKGNTVIIIEHDSLFMEASDHIIDMGPGAGKNGGNIVAEGNYKDILSKNTITGQWLSGRKEIKSSRTQKKPIKWLKIHGAREHNLKGDLIEIPHGMLVGICGVSGSGKSTLLIDTLGRALIPQKYTTSVAREPLKPGEHDKIEGILPETIIIDQTKKKIGSPLKFLGLEQPIIKVFADSEDAKLLGLDKTDLAKKCSACKGRGYLKEDMGFLPDIIEVCETCHGSGFQAEAREVKYKDVSLAEIGNLTIEEALEVFKEHETIASKFQASLQVGLNYLQLNQPARSLSGGEAQRLKIVKELSKNAKKKTLYILDEPTIGQHLEDVAKLVGVLHALVERGNTVVVIEHHPHLLASCDWLIELGPGAGESGGNLIAAGPPGVIAEKKTPTAPFIKQILGGKS